MGDTEKKILAGLGLAAATYLTGGLAGAWTLPAMLGGTGAAAGAAGAAGAGAAAAGSAAAGAGAGATGAAAAPTGLAALLGGAGKAAMGGAATSMGGLAMNELAGPGERTSTTNQFAPIPSMQPMQDPFEWFKSLQMKGGGQ